MTIIITPDVCPDLLSQCSGFCINRPGLTMLVGPAVELSVAHFGNRMKRLKYFLDCRICNLINL